VIGESWLRRWWSRVAETLDHRVGWHRLPLPLALLSLIGIRDELRAENLYDTYGGAPPPAPQPPSPGDLVARTVDGSYNDLGAPSMGMAGTRFGRNVPLGDTQVEQPPALFEPNPRTISDVLLLRRDFKPATTLNVLAAAWLQFQTRDWLSHGTDGDNPILVPRPPGDDWPEDPMRWPRTPSDPTNPSGAGGRTFVNTETSWWDASQVYGSRDSLQKAVRTGERGRVRIGDDGLVDVDPAVLASSGGADGWWLGLELMHTLFMREHNAICDRLASAYPTWDDGQLFAKARLINAALIAKIHTVEWTTAILGHPALQVGMRANWFGLAGERVRRLAGRISSSEVISGIPGSPTNHHGVPYAMTEEFVAVYRMHPLIPDDYVLREAPSGAVLERLDFLDLHGLNSRPVLERTGVENAFYSFGVANPGAVRLHNNPRFMHRLQRTDGLYIDLAAIDILRSRERGVPRYNEFRRLLHMTPVERFEQLGDDPETVEQLQDVYQGDLEKVDATVGMFGEQLPRGFGFSDTAFRIFVLMASRRLKSDRFFTVDFTPRMYTPEGFSWLEDNDMSSVLLRHYPVLQPALRGVRNAFAPWPAPAA
jgi:Animal haem peroxidase